MTSINAQRITSFHSDFIHDIQFDFYGNRIATCSGDRTVKIWNLHNGKFSSASEILIDSDGVNEQKSSNESKSVEPMSIQAHRSAVWRVSWAHPEFGQLLATCGADKNVCIFEEVQTGAMEPLGMGTGAVNGLEASTTWVEKAKLSEASRSVSVVQFAPAHHGLMLASGSADGIVRIYEAIDVMDLDHWTLKGSIEISGGNIEKNELGVTSISWCNGLFEPPTLVVGGSSGCVLVYRYSASSNGWDLILQLTSHLKGVLDVAWAPNVGRSYHLISSTGKDCKTIVHKLKRGKKGDGERTLEKESSQELDTGSRENWRCKWNVTGTVLATSGDFGRIQLWKCDFKRNSWKCVSEVVGEALDKI